jgi:hypothetical protein
VYRPKITRRSVICVGLGTLSAAAVSPWPLLAQDEGGADASEVSGVSDLASIQSVTESSQADFAATAYAYVDWGNEYSSQMSSTEPDIDTFIASERFAAATPQASGDPSGSLLSPVDIISSLLSGSLDSNPEGGENTNIWKPKESDVYGDSLALTAETFKWFTATAEEIAPPIDAAGKIYGIYSAIHEQADKDPSTAELNAGVSIVFNYAAGEAAAAVGEFTFTVVAPVVVAYTSPVWAVPVAVIATGVTLYSSHVLSNV